MKNTDMIKIPAAETGMTFTCPVWCVLEGLLNLSDEDKATIATVLMDHVKNPNPTLKLMQQRYENMQEL